MESKMKPHTVEILGREILVNAPEDGQLVQFMRGISAMNRASGGQPMIMAIARILDVLVALVGDHEDRQFLEDGLTEGTIGLDDMTAMMESLVPAEEAPKAGPAKRVSAARGRR